MAEQIPTIGIIGLGVMGYNLALNMQTSGLNVIGYSISEAERNQARGGTEPLRVVDSLETLIATLPEQKILFVMITAGAPVDELLGQLLPCLSSSDMVIDGGNSNYLDTQRRVARCAELGVVFLGVGISGGEEGARHGASVMVGGDKKHFDRVEAVFDAIACRVGDEACYGWMGSSSAGHFVKMVHNGIEYAVMQLLAETYDLCRRGLGLNITETRDWFAKQQGGPLDSYLLDITVDILKKQDDLTSGLLIEQVSDIAGQKGTGRWCVDAAMTLGVPAPAIIAAVTERQISGSAQTRQTLAQVSGRRSKAYEWDTWQEDLADGLYAGMLVTFAQGLSLIRQASQEYNWGTDLRAAIRLWRGGCIIRAALLETLLSLGETINEQETVLLVPAFSQEIFRRAGPWARVVNAGVLNDLPVPVYAINLAYLNSMSSERLPTQLIQAQRDYFGAHTFKRLDRDGVFHADWQE
ncbi:MAG: NADP-dependent phosphogluconate dehydrogenase [Pseudomonadota bacterium]